VKRHFTWRRVVFGCMLLFALASYAVPKFTEGWFRYRLLGALEEGLGRKIEIGQVHFRFVPTPGFAIGDVRIGEDPSVGAEPAAWIDTLVVRPSLIALLTGRFAVGSLRLEDDDGSGISLNLTRVDSGSTGVRWNAVRWNFSMLAARAGSGGVSVARAADFPDIHMAGGRINFKFGETKSIFYLRDTDVDVSRSSSDGQLKIRISGQPARTDRSSQARGFGNLIAAGHWNTADHSLELDVKLEKSELSDVLTLFEGREPALLGKISGDAHLAGPMAKIGVTGRVNVSDLHGWNQSPPGGNEWPFNIGGIVNASAQTIELQASGAGKPSPVGARVSVADYLGRPRWAAAVSLDGVPVAPITGIARNFGLALPDDLAMDGTALGTVGYSTTSGAPGMDGQVRVSNATLAAKGSPPLKIARADVKFSGSSIALSPTPIVNDAGESAAIDARYDTASGSFEASLTSDGMAISSLRRQISVAGAPVIGLTTAGTWSGSLHYASPLPDAPDSNAGGWTGYIHLRDTDIPFEAFAQPIHLLDADVTIDASGAQMKRVSLIVGGIAAQGEYRYETGADHPHRLRIWLPSTRAEDLEAALMPALRRGNALTYAFNFGRVPQPDWLRNMHAEGSIEASLLELAGTEITGLRANLVWDGMEVSLKGVSGHATNAAFTGSAVVYLAGRQPRYDVTGSVTGLAWQGGTLSAKGELKTAGIGADLLAGLRAEGTFSARKLEMISLNPWDSAEGRFEFAFANATPKLRVPELTIQSAGTKWTGAAETQDGGQFVVRVADGARHLEASGALLRGEGLKVAQ